MRSYDVFNGDADGICALLQLRLASPCDAELVTGVKRDIALLKQVPCDAPAKVTVLDISLDKNRDALERLLASGSRVFYCDHHYPGESLPDLPGFTGLIDTQPTTCTSLLVDRYLNGRFHHWALAAAFGDNLNAVALTLAAQAGLSQRQAEELRELGVCLNYNGYGSSLEDLHFHPARLYSELLPYTDPLDVIADQPEIWRQLSAGYAEDMACGLGVKPLHRCAHAHVVLLPDQPWARRVSGVLGNDLANCFPDQACAVITEVDASHYLVSIRAPLNNRTGADELARQFPTGGGRQAAAGINLLPKANLSAFIDAMVRQFSSN
ncbi:MAG: DHH family phosphoesterase [Pseudomonas sp.]|nr:DHH family phosphoesterase [Pseudomonas sp.]MPT17397.1 DHH family phosphoesterase [Pseudomonas sp.]